MTAAELANVPTKSTVSMHYEDRLVGIEQMLADLNRLATEDGCIAAAWAAEFLEELTVASTKHGGYIGG